MVSLVKMQDMLKHYSIADLEGMLARPTGAVPSYLVLAQLERYRAMEKESQKPPSKSVTDELVEPSAQMMAGAPSPASQGIATLRKGGVVRMQTGGAPTTTGSPPVTWWNIITGNFPPGSEPQLNQENRLLRTQVIEAQEEDAASDAARQRDVAKSQDAATRAAGTAQMRRELTNRQFPPQGDPGSIVPGNQPPPPPPATTAPAVTSTAPAVTSAAPVDAGAQTYAEREQPQAVAAAARRAVTTVSGAPAGGGGGGGGAGGGAGGYGGGSGGYGGAPSAPGSTPSALDELRTAIGKMPTEYADAMGPKVDPQARAKERRDDALNKFFADLAANKSRGFIDAVGAAAGPALAGMQAARTEMRREQRADGENWLKSKEAEIKGLYYAGAITQQQMEAELKNAASLAATGAHSASTAESARSRVQTAADARASRELIAADARDTRIELARDRNLLAERNQYFQRLTALNDSWGKRIEGTVGDDRKAFARQWGIDQDKLNDSYRAVLSQNTGGTPPAGATVREFR